ncbi:hypothetical protein [Roseofilum capinflatum]|uniref:Uncharacterized protein n=1 Tax=Roseofilum capinflatum BLCC-M114 TaxID=3022440 RepID=A0ABT7B9R0_9CYAN|nr:hypothetical protein [Roseofilum capinflatum]MDJ1175918.1 hypothetical protein [Roseofilum capinflatum BLCC-M114]
MRFAVCVVVAIAISVATVLLLVHPAAANGFPPMALLFPLPLFASLVSFGAGFLLILVCEALTLHKRETIVAWYAFRLVTEANLLSTLAGAAVLFFFFIGFFDISISLWTNPILFLSIGFSTACFLKRFTYLKHRSPLFWSGVWIVLLYVDGLLLVVLGVNTEGLFLTLLKFLGVAVYFAIGFFLSLIVEGAWLGWRLPPGKTLGKTLLIMNLRSYAYIVIPITVVMLIM